MHETETLIPTLVRVYEAQADALAAQAVKTLFTRSRAFGFQVCHTAPLQTRDEKEKISAAAKLLLFVVTGAMHDLDLSALEPATRLYQDALLLTANVPPKR